MESSESSSRAPAGVSISTRCALNGAEVGSRRPIRHRRDAAYRTASYVYVKRPDSYLIQLRRHLRRLLLLCNDRLVHVAPVLQADVRVVRGARHRHERSQFGVRQ